MNLATGSIKNRLIHQEKYKKFYRKMTYDETKVINNELLNVLKVFDEICRANNIKYLVVAGALIGAVRDHSCIAWDDDIDLVMPRPDYVRFRKIFEKSKYADDYRMVYPEDNHIVTMGAHFYRKAGRLTNLIDESIGESLIYEPYSYLDIVPLDSCSNSKWKDKIRGLFVNALQMGYISRRCFKKYDPFLNYLAKDSTELRCNLRIRELFALPFLLIPKKTIFYLLEKMLKYDDKSDYMTISFGAKRYFGEKLPRSFWLPVVDVELNGQLAMAPHEPDKYLRHRYGNYMVVPTQEEQEERMIRLRGDWQSLIKD